MASDGTRRQLGQVMPKVVVRLGLAEFGGLPYPASLDTWLMLAARSPKIECMVNETCMLSPGTGLSAANAKD